MNRQRPVLVCDDDPDVTRLLGTVLTGQGYAVVTACSVREALDHAGLQALSAAIVDLVLPDGDGVDLCRRLHEWAQDLPVIVLSGIPDEQTKIRALDAGADDYITKPFSNGELMARLRAVIRRTEPPRTDSVIVSDGLEIDLAAHRVRLDGADVQLTPTEFELLRVLVQHPGDLVTHRTLLSEVWGPAYEDDRLTLQSHLANLRRKIDPHRRYIVTEFGLGYRFVG
jgi:two-component system KDP operon response regulator KdpE